MVTRPKRGKMGKIEREKGGRKRGMAGADLGYGRQRSECVEKKWEKVGGKKGNSWIWVEKVGKLGFGFGMYVMDDKDGANQIMTWLEQKTR